MQGSKEVLVNYSNLMHSFQMAIHELYISSRALNDFKYRVANSSDKETIHKYSKKYFDYAQIFSKEFYDVNLHTDLTEVLRGIQQMLRGISFSTENMLNGLGIANSYSNSYSNSTQKIEHIPYQFGQQLENAYYRLYNFHARVSPKIINIPRVREENREGENKVPISLEEETKIQMERYRQFVLNTNNRVAKMNDSSYSLWRTHFTHLQTENYTLIQLIKTVIGLICINTEDYGEFESTTIQTALKRIFLVLHGDIHNLSQSSIDILTLDYFFQDVNRIKLIEYCDIRKNLQREIDNYAQKQPDLVDVYHFIKEIKFKIWLFPKLTQYLTKFKALEKLIKNNESIKLKSEAIINETCVGNEICSLDEFSRLYNLDYTLNIAIEMLINLIVHCIYNSDSDKLDQYDDNLDKLIKNIDHLCFASFHKRFIQLGDPISSINSLYLYVYSRIKNNKM